jgi:hypothetical protein
MELFMSFWDVIVLITWGFLFAAYLVVLFQIVGDLFRDPKVGGFAKAIWILVLIAIPFLSALIYLIARGRGMAERQVAAVSQLEQAQAAYIRSVSGTSPAEQIASAKELLDTGAISQSEFDTLKAKAMAS